MRSVPFAVALLAFSGLANAATSNEASQQSSHSTPTLQVYSRETDVDVVVTDSRGNPVYGLKPSDFTLEEDGKPQRLTNFSESTAPAPSLRSRLDEPARTLPPNVYTNYEATPASGPVNIVLLDALNSSPVLIDYAEQQLNHYFRDMPSGTKFAIFWLSTGGLHMLQGFTSDRALLEKATITNRTDFGVDEIEWTRRWHTIDALEQIAEFVSGIKGRKNLLWFTPRPLFVLHDGGYGWMQPPDPVIVHRLMDTYGLFTNEQIAVCPIDPHGVHGLKPVQLVMSAVAQETGGFAYYNNNDLARGIAQAVRDGSHFYTLTYIPQHKDTGHFYAIKVQVDHPGLKLVYRQGYVAEQPHSPDLTGQQLMTASLDGKAPPSTQILFDARIRPLPASATAPQRPAPTKTQITPYDVLLNVPTQQFELTKNSNGKYTDSLQFSVTAYDIDGKLMDRFTYNVNLNLTQQQYARFMSKPLLFHFYNPLPLPAGQYSVHAGVLDQNSNKVGTIEVPIFNWQSEKQARQATSLVPLHQSQNGP